MGIVASHSTEGRRQVEQIRLDGLKTAAERNKWGQFATPPELALNLARYARNLAGESAIRFLDPAIGTGSFYSLQPGLQAPQSSSTGVFLDPLTIWNAATFAPITNSVAPGEFVSLFGTGLAAGTLQASRLPFSTTLGGVQVKVNGRLAPLTYVSRNQINVLNPYATSEPYATFQVFNAGVASNAVNTWNVA